MPSTQVIKICDWCHEPIATGAPYVQTNNVDIQDVLGARAQVVATKKRTYHTQEPECYRVMLDASRVGAGKGPDTGSAAIAQEAFDWSDAFGMTAEETLSGARNNPKKQRRSRIFGFRKSGHERRRIAS